MPRQSNGIYVQPTGTAAVNLATIDPAEFNTLITDIGTEITGSLPRNGSAAAAAAIPMGGFKITGLGTPAASTDAATKAYVDALLPSGTVVVFAQAAAPTGWTQVTTSNDYLLRLVNGGTGGTANWQGGASAYASTNGGSHVLTWNEMPSHNHSASDGGHTHSYTGGNPNNCANGGGYVVQNATANAGTGFTTGSGGNANITVGYAGANYGHQHTQAALTYIDVIFCSKN